MTQIAPGDVWSMASTKLREKSEPPAVGFSMSKYHRWYDGIIDRAKGREIPACYTEIHHIVPRSLGGTDASVNLVRLTYREHFLAHWLLTRICSGSDLRKMQRAMMAMSFPAKGGRIIAGWQFEAAKRAVRDLEIDPEAERLWYERWNLSYAERLARFKRNKRRGTRKGSRSRQKAA